TGRQIRLRRLVAQFRVAGRSAVRRDTAQLARRKKMDDGTARTSVTEKSRRLYRFIWSGRRWRALRFDEWPKLDYRQHWKSLQTGGLTVSIERLRKLDRTAIRHRAEASVEMIKTLVHQFERNHEVAQQLVQEQVRLDVRAKPVTAKQNVTEKEPVVFAIKNELR